jgi:hypothetical protein
LNRVNPCVDFRGLYWRLHFVEQDGIAPQGAHALSMIEAKVRLLNIGRAFVARRGVGELFLL